MPLNIVRDDLANAQADAIVVPANEQLAVSGGAGEAVARKAGLLRVRLACRRIGGCPTGGAVSTKAFSLPARYLIHAVGPMWQGAPDDAAKLRSAYDAALELAAQLGCSSVALPLLSAGSYGCPVYVSLSLALSSIEDFLVCNDLKVTLVLFDKRAVMAGLDFIDEIESRIDDAAAEYRIPRDRGTALLGSTPGDREPQDSLQPPLAQAGVMLSPQRTEAIMPPAQSPYGAPAQHSDKPAATSRQKKRSRKTLGVKRDRTSKKAEGPSGSVVPTGPAPTSPTLPSPTVDEGAALFDHDFPDVPACASIDSLEDRLIGIESGFSETLLALVDASGLTDAEVYRRANMSRQHFSKIRNNVGYRPTKPTVLALCIALELDLGQTRDLLARAGFVLTHASKFDIILEYFIEHGVYDPFKINETLFYFDQPLLGG